MGFFRWLGQIMQPCIHTWRIISKMEDDPKAPTNVHIVRECEICGELEVLKFEGPKRQCPPHRWKTLDKAAVWASPNAKFPVYHRANQECLLCGEVRAVNLKPEEEDDEE